MSSIDKDESKTGVDPHRYSPERLDEEVGIVAKGGKLHAELKGRHMQMIAIGGAIGAGLFIGSGGALYKGGPAALV